MTIKERILTDLTGIRNPRMLNQIFEFIQMLKDSYDASGESNKDKVLGFKGSISDDDAEELTTIINSEFNKIEGDW